MGFCTIFAPSRGTSQCRLMVEEINTPAGDVMSGRTDPATGNLYRAV
ncbi:hypothetical protein AmDm5_1844 [Acetobacter malorum]|nr:hypothetical protein AmDm5_1844 [Acetobacter malorum]